jgi:hypothetical protein
VLCRPLFGIAGLVLGIIHLAGGQRRIRHGIAQVGLSICFALVGTAVGVAATDWASRAESEVRVFGIAGLAFGLIHLTRRGK